MWWRMSLDGASLVSADFLSLNFGACCAFVLFKKHFEEKLMNGEKRLFFFRIFLFRLLVFILTYVLASQ